MAQSFVRLFSPTTNPVSNLDVNNMRRDIEKALNDILTTTKTGPVYSSAVIFQGRNEGHVIAHSIMRI